MLNLHETIFVHRYTLKSHRPLNAVSGRCEFEGALIKIGDGVGCLHPWPEFGDLPLDRLLSILQKGGNTGMIERTRVCCLLDGSARRLNRSEFTSFTSPASHTYEPDPSRVVKVKCSGDVKKEADRIRTIAGRKLRLDFNGLLTMDQFRQFVRLLDDATSARIDFVEDPFDADQYWWDKVQRETPFALASDRQPLAAHVNVLKPALDRLRTHHERVVFTSYLDHPIGQFFAAREAAAYYAAQPQQLEVCGLATHVLFEPDEFLERMQTDADGRLIPVGGSGFGFDDLLEKLPWERLH